LVKDSWNLFRKMDPHQIGNVFYNRLFLQMPSLRSMFKPSMKDQYAHASAGSRRAFKNRIDR